MADSGRNTICYLTLLVHLAEDWLADVGFGDSFRLPLQFRPDLEHVEGEQVYRLMHNAPYWILQKRSGDGPWKADYRFTLQPHTLADFTEMCYYQQTSPESHFTHGRVCSLATPEGRVTLSEMRLITTLVARKASACWQNQEEYEQVLTQQFGVVLN